MSKSLNALPTWTPAQRISFAWHRLYDTCVAATVLQRPNADSHGSPQSLRTGVSKAVVLHIADLLSRCGFSSSIAASHFELSLSVPISLSHLSPLSAAARSVDELRALLFAILREHVDESVENLDAAALVLVERLDAATLLRDSRVAMKAKATAVDVGSTPSPQASHSVEKVMNRNAAYLVPGTPSKSSTKSTTTGHNIARRVVWVLLLLAITVVAFWDLTSRPDVSMPAASLRLGVASRSHTQSIIPEDRNDGSIGASPIHHHPADDQTFHARLPRHVSDSVNPKLSMNMTEARVHPSHHALNLHTHPMDNPAIPPHVVYVDRRNPALLPRRRQWQRVGNQQAIQPYDPVMAEVHWRVGHQGLPRDVAIHLPFTEEPISVAHEAGPGAPRHGSFLEFEEHRRISSPAVDRATSGTCRTQKAAGIPAESALRLTLDLSVDASKSLHTRAEVHAEAMLQLARAYAAPMQQLESAYHTFLDSHGAVVEAVRMNASCVLKAMTPLDLQRPARGCVDGFEPFAMDVVYTYVSSSAPSHRRAYSQYCHNHRQCNENRFRDLGELRYSLRTVLTQGMSLVRRVVIVVADRDQLPKWLNVLHPRLSVVTHQELFSAEEAAVGLPTFNSHAIESVLYRIPGLSKFFVYFNNDMLWGRRVSLFDYFRPMALERQEYREARYGLQGALGPGGLGAAGWERTAEGRYRVSVWLEPIFYFEASENPSENMVLPKASARQPSASEQAVCAVQPLAATDVFDIRQRQGLSDYWREFSNHNKRLLFERVIGGWPSHSFAHYPRVMDRDLTRQMLEHEFADEAAIVRGLRTRETAMIWTTWMHAYYALGARRRIDGALLGERGLWRRSAGPYHHLSDISPLGDEVNRSPLPRLLLPKPLDVLSSPIAHSRLAEEKLLHSVVAFGDKREPIYHFFMMHGPHEVLQFTWELSLSRKLFITLNDDLPHVSKPLAALIDDLMQTASGRASRGELEK